MSNKSTSKEKTESKILCFKNIASVVLKFLWFPYIPLGKITVLQGDPAGGKSFLSMLFASIVSNGGSFPYTDCKTEVGKVILQNGEDGLDDTIKPRLEVLKANCENIFVIDERKKFYTFKNMDIFVEACNEIKPKLIVIDPLQRYLGDIDMSSAVKVRLALSPVVKLAQRYNCAVIIVSHMNKGTGKALYKTLGSIDIVGVARSVLTVGVNPTNKKERILSHTKSSCATKGDSLGFIINDNGIEWTGIRNHLDSDDTISGEQEGARDYASIFLKELLQDGAVDSNIVIEKANENGIKKATLDRAKKELNIQSVSTGGRSRAWVLPKEE